MEEIMDSDSRDQPDPTLAAGVPNELSTPTSTARVGRVRAHPGKAGATRPWESIRPSFPQRVYEQALCSHSLVDDLLDLVFTLCGRRHGFAEVWGARSDPTSRGARMSGSIRDSLS